MEEVTTQAQVLEGTVSAVIYQNEENGYTILRLDCGEEETTVVGAMPGISPGEYLSVRGRWTRHPTYGSQFKAEVVERRLPQMCIRDSPEHPWPSGQIGVEVRREGTVVFRGGYTPPGRMINDYWARDLVWEDGSDYVDWSPGIYATTSTGEIIGLTGQVAAHTVHQPQLLSLIHISPLPWAVPWRSFQQLNEIIISSCHPSL